MPIKDKGHWEQEKAERVFSLWCRSDSFERRGGRKEGGNKHFRLQWSLRKSQPAHWGITTDRMTRLYRPTVFSHCLGASSEWGLGLNVALIQRRSPGVCQLPVLLPAGSWRELWGVHLRGGHRWSIEWGNQRRTKLSETKRVITEARHSTEGLKIKVEKLSQNVEWVKEIEIRKIFKMRH